MQGVGFRPTVWRMARELGLSGEVRNDAEGVLIRVAGGSGAIAALLDRIRREPPPLAHIERIERSRSAGVCTPGFRIVDSAAGTARTQIAPDAAVCIECAREVLRSDAATPPLWLCQLHAVRTAVQHHPQHSL